MEGLVRIEPHRGAIVLPVTVEDVEEIYFLRALLEGIAVEKGLPYLEQEDLEELELSWRRWNGCRPKSLQSKSTCSTTPGFIACCGRPARGGASKA